MMSRYSVKLGTMYCLMIIIINEPNLHFNRPKAILLTIMFLTTLKLTQFRHISNKLRLMLLIERCYLLWLLYIQWSNMCHSLDKKVSELKKTTVTVMSSRHIRRYWSGTNNICATKSWSLPPRAWRIR